MAEGINGILKAEFGLGDLSGAEQEVEPLVIKSIRLNNELRPHSICSYLIPYQMHQQDKVTIKTYRIKKPEPTSAPISEENKS
ncbi:hypothetical protein HU175_08805 [Spirosoma sp. KUDC1026]|nr:hypothetical protein HU175_08805 [Spirosoma sp. KUDC1026]